VKRNSTHPTRNQKDIVLATPGEREGVVGPLYRGEREKKPFRSPRRRKRESAREIHWKPREEEVSSIWKRDYLLSYHPSGGRERSFRINREKKKERAV